MVILEFDCLLPKSPFDDVTESNISLGITLDDDVNRPILGIEPYLLVVERDDALHALRAGRELQNGSDL